MNALPIASFAGEHVAVTRLDIIAKARTVNGNTDIRCVRREEKRIRQRRIAMKIYIASSWKNQHAVQMMTALLRERGHEVVAETYGLSA